MESTKHTELSAKSGADAASDPQVAPVSPEAMRHGYEPSGIQTRALLICVIVLVITAIVIHVALWFVQSGLLAMDRRTDIQTSGVAHIPPPQTAPPLQPSPEHDTRDRQDLQIMYAAENQVFDRLGWTKSGTDQAHVPDSVVEAVAHRAPPAPATNPTARGTP